MTKTGVGQSEVLNVGAQIDYLTICLHIKTGNIFKGVFVSSTFDRDPGPQPQFVFDGAGHNLHLAAIALNLYLLFPALKLYLPVLPN